MPKYKYIAFGYVYNQSGQNQRGVWANFFELPRIKDVSRALIGQHNPYVGDCSDMVRATVGDIHEVNKDGRTGKRIWSNGRYV